MEDEIDGGDFLEIDPREGFSVRNFQIQACKMATVSDVVVYGDDKTPQTEVEKLAKRISRAQALWQKKVSGLEENEERPFNTFVVMGKWRSLVNVRVAEY